MTNKNTSNNSNDNNSTVSSNYLASTTTIRNTVLSNNSTNNNATVALNSLASTTSIINSSTSNNLLINNPSTITNRLNGLLTNNTNSNTTESNNEATNISNRISSVSNTLGMNITNRIPNTSIATILNATGINTTSSNNLATNSLNTQTNKSYVSKRSSNEVNQNSVYNSNSATESLLLRNIFNFPNQNPLDSNLRSIVTTFQANREAIANKFKAMPSYRYIGEIEDVSLITQRNSSNDLCYKSVICLNKIKTTDFDFTKFYHVDKNQLIDFFRNKKYEIHLRIGFNLNNIYVPNQLKIQLDRRPFFFSRHDDILSVNLTSYFTRFYKTFNPISLEIDDHTHFYYCGIYIFKKLTSSDFFTNFVFNPVNTNILKPNNAIIINKIDKLEYVKTKCVLEKEHTIRMIREKLRPVDSDFQIETDFIKVSFICPLTQLRIKIPSRGKMCKHLQCFDLESYIMLNEKCEKWLCPICDNCIVYTNLVIDNFYKEISEKCKYLDEAKIDSDGKVIQENSQTPTMEDSLDGTIQIDDMSISNESIKITTVAPNDSCIILD